jgi:hypothetical protein
MIPPINTSFSTIWQMAVNVKAYILGLTSDNVLDVVFSLEFGFIDKIYSLQGMLPTRGEFNG